MAMEMMKNGEFRRKGGGNVEFGWRIMGNVEENIVPIGSE